MLFDTGAMKSVMSLEMYKKLKLKDLNTTSIPHIVGASGKSLGTRGRTKCKVNINGRIFYQTFIVCEHLKRPLILGRDFSIQNCIGISWTKTNTHQLTQNNEVIAETAEYQTPSRASVSLKKNIKIPPRSCTVVDVDINTTEKIKVEVIPNQLWLSANPNICTYPMIADLKEREPNTVTPFVIVNFSHHKHLHLPKDHVVAFTEKDCNEGEVLEICTMEQLEKGLPRNWIPERKWQEKFKIFDGSNKAECITWLSQVEAAAKFTNSPFRELICQSMAPAMLHIFSDLSALASDADIKEAILTNTQISQVPQKQPHDYRTYNSP